MPDKQQQDNDFSLPAKKEKTITPLHSSNDEDPALSLIRSKISALYEDEPEAEEELQTAENTPAVHRSKHQHYMYELERSGLSLSEIQTKWHEYYQSLPDHEKHEVWDEFYTQHARSRSTTDAQDHPEQQTDAQSAHISKPEQHTEETKTLAHPDKTSKKDIKEIQSRVRSKISSTSSAHKANLKSLVFGLAMGSFVLLFALFGFFNERFIAPFITPSRVLSSTPLIIDGNTPVGTEPKVIIPKINVDVPVVYGESSIAEGDVQDALEDGILHYPTTPEPGEKGNSVFFGHSSNNIFNPGQYKFAFVLLNQLEEGDTFMLEKDGTRYIYRVFDTEIVAPTNLSVLRPHPDYDSIATLITCDPPGTSINRLVVYGEQISPSPEENTTSDAPLPSEAPQPEQLPSDAPSLWSRFF